MLKTSGKNGSKKHVYMCKMAKAPQENKTYTKLTSHYTLTRSLT